MQVGGNPTGCQGRSNKAKRTLLPAECNAAFDGLGSAGSLSGCAERTPIRVRECARRQAVVLPRNQFGLKAKIICRRKRK